MIPLAEGGLMRRPASRYVADEKSSSVKGRLKRFEFSTTQAYMTELGEKIMRFYRHQGQIVAGDTDASIRNGAFGSDIDSAFSQVWQVDDTPSDNAFVDETTDANDVGDGDWTVFPGTEAIGDYVAFGYTSTFAQIRFDYANGTAGVAGEVGWEYWNGSAWASLVAVVDDTTGFTAAAADDLTASWTVPSDWAAVVINSSASLFYVRAIITKVYSTNPVLDQGFVRASWADKSTGGAGNLISYDSTNKRMTLETNGTASSDIGIGEQQFDVGASFDTNEHILKFRVLGAPGDRILLRIGTATGGTQIVNDEIFEVGFHCKPFTPGDSNNSIYVQFRNRGDFRDKDMQIDDVSLIDNTGVEVDTPWSEANLFTVNGPQSADVLYLYHPSHPTYKLLRLGHTQWSLVEVVWEDGPYLAENSTTTTMTASAATGLGITVTASSIVGINGGDGFKTTDVGRLIRITDEGTVNWGWGVIVTRSSTTVVLVDIRRTFTVTTAETRWRLGAWSSTTGYPSGGSFYEQRQFAFNTTDQPQTLWATQTADFENHTPDSDPTADTFDGTVEDDDALDYTISADEVNAIRWMSPGEDTLVLGTTGGEWIPESAGIVITPSDIVVRRRTKHGSANIQPVRVGNVVLFVQKAKRKIREFGFAFEVDGFRAFDMTRLAQHIATRKGIAEMDFQQEPDSLVWAVRNDGQLLSMTFRREEDVVGWARHILGGSFGSGDAVVESVAVIPGADGSGQTQSSEDRDEVWITVKRTIDGVTKRYIEVLERDYEDGDDEEDSYYADSIITFDGAAASSITGLDHLEGETVKIFADGFIHPDKTVASGAIILDNAASVVQVGLGYAHTIKPLKFEGGTAAGTAVGKTKQVFGVTFVLLNSHTLTFGPDVDNLTTIDFRAVSDPMDTAVPFFTGEHFEPFEDDWKTDPRIVIQSDDPVPFTLLALAPEIDTRELK